MGRYITNFGGFGGPPREKLAVIYQQAAKELNLPITVSKNPMPLDGWGIEEDGHYDPRQCNGMWSLYFDGSFVPDLSEFWALARCKEG